jgi:hypothetical protein
VLPGIQDCPACSSLLFSVAFGKLARSQQILHYPRIVLILTSAAYHRQVEQVPPCS